MSNVNPILALYVKSAGPNPPPTMDDVNLNSGMRDVGNVGLAALGAGVGIRGLVGLYNLINQKVNPPTTKYPGALVTRMPIPVDGDEPAGASMPGKRRHKMAIDQSGVTDYTHQWWYPGAMVGAGALGLYGGYKGLDWLLDKRKRDARSQDLDDARQDFEQAMLESYPKPRKPSGLNIPPSAKLAEDQETNDAEKLSAALDELYDKLQEKQAAEKKAISWKDVYTLGGMLRPDTGQQLLGAYGVYALGAGGLTGKMVYDQSVKSNDSAILQKAMARRQRRAYAQRPSDILAVPEEVKVPSDNEFEQKADEDASMGADPSEPMAPANTKMRNRKIIRGIL